MKRHVKLFESYIREYSEYQQDSFPGYGGGSDPVLIAHKLASKYRVDPSALDANLNALGVDTGAEEQTEEQTDEYGVAFVAGIGIMVTTLVGLVSASFLGARIEGLMKNKRWLQAEIEDRVEKMMEEMPDAEEKTIMEEVTNSVMNDPQIAQKLQNWKKERGGAPVHKRHRGPVYGYRGHVFGSGE